MEKNDVEKYVNELTPVLTQYDKIYFHGLSHYRKIVEEISEIIDVDIEIYPNFKNTDRNKLDVIELMKQPKYMRRDISANLGLKESVTEQRQILEYV